jgi:hypothetical protein
MAYYLTAQVLTQLLLAVLRLWPHRPQFFVHGVAHRFVHGFSQRSADLLPSLP